MNIFETLVDVKLTCRGVWEEQEMEQQGELQHGAEVKTTRWRYS